MKYVAAAILAAFLLGGCQWIEPPPDHVAQEKFRAATLGCLAGMVTLAGPPPSEQAKQWALDTCLVIGAHFAKDDGSEPIEDPTNPLATPEATF